MESYHPYTPFGEFGAPSTHYAPVHSHSTATLSTERHPDPNGQVVERQSDVYYSNSVPPHSHPLSSPSDTSYAPAPPTLSSISVPAQTHAPHLSTEATPSYPPAGYHEAAYPMYDSQAFGMGMGLGNGMAVEPSYEMGIAGGYNMANFGGFDSSMNAGIGGGVDAGSYHPYGFQNPSVDERMAYAPHFVQQAPANVSIFPGF
ncbi:hypothetical protein SCHPADRAFT_232063 [Schizopora paradoxa]|uniref:Uncharacterized protein n=1 Tax=Schizopora paradoxa TaxID=27342 RepID=A0A0H2SG39_9AGAM|nr:hypothetical protein SCHPADRAFT_232063 [Schizopora paradoxa]